MSPICPCGCGRGSRSPENPYHSGKCVAIHRETVRAQKREEARSRRAPDGLTGKQRRKLEKRQRREGTTPPVVVFYEEADEETTETPE